jgi:hypothetical protein
MASRHLVSLILSFTRVPLGASMRSNLAQIRVAGLRDLQPWLDGILCVADLNIFLGGA